MAKVKLGVGERFVIPTLFPGKGSYVENTVRDGAAKKVAITEDEIKEFGIESTPEGNVKWDAEKVKEVSIDLSDAAVVVIKTALKKLDEESALTRDHMTLYEKFVANAPSTDEKIKGKIDKKE